MDMAYVARTLRRAIAALKELPESHLQKLGVFECAIALDALPDMHELQPLRRQLADRLHAKLHPAWLQNGPMADVFAALAAVWNYNPQLVNGACLTHAIQRLITSEAAVGGPYYCDGTLNLVANIQIAICMRRAAKPLPKVDDFITAHIAKSQFGHTELTRFGLLFLIAKTGNAPQVAHYVHQYWQQKSWQTPLRRAVAITILKDSLPLRRMQQNVMFLCHAQHASGFWDSESFLKTSSSQQAARFTATACITGVLAHYYYSHRNSRPPGLLQKHQQVVLAAKSVFAGCAEPLRSHAFTTIRQVAAADKDFEITLLPRFFAESLKIPAPLTDRHYTMLGLANISGWIAYTIYDDFLDDQGTPALLPTANIAMRTSVDSFRAAVPHSPAFQRYVTKVYAKMDEANTWEVTNCRFIVRANTITIAALPKYGKCATLAARSFAHALGPLAVLSRHTPITPQMRCIQNAFKHYLIARQLNDDMRDWLRDIQKGHASYVVTAILRDMRRKPGTYAVPTLLPIMQKQFRQKTMPKVCQRILRHIAIARQAFSQSDLLRPTSSIYLLLDNVEASVQRSLATHAKAQALYDLAKEFR